MKNRRNKKIQYHMVALLCTLILVFTMSGCKIEKPEDVQKNVTSTTGFSQEPTSEIVDSDEDNVESDMLGNEYLGLDDIADSTEDLSKYDDLTEGKDDTQVNEKEDLAGKQTISSNGEKEKQEEKQQEEKQQEKEQEQEQEEQKQEEEQDKADKEKLEESKKETTVWNHDNDKSKLEFNDKDKDGRDDTTGLDKFLTDPIPEGKPNPVEFNDVNIDKGKVYYCTLTIRMDTILNNRNDLDSELLYLLDKDGIKDGVIYAERKVEFYEGESVFDVLLRETKAERIHMEFSFTPMYNSHYIEGINNFYEFSCGELSGWMYKVNGWFPNYGCSRYQLEDGDIIEWVYTCDLGRDVGEDLLGGTK